MFSSAWSQSQYITDPDLYVHRPIIPNKVGGQNAWDYSPSAMIDYGVEKVWWCSGPGPGDASPNLIRDVIRYKERINNGPWIPSDQGLIVFDPNQGRDAQYKPSWEGKYVCDPTVIRGNWSLIPAGAAVAKAYTYAMYYGASDPLTDHIGGYNNRIGVLFSQDGKTWDRPAKLNAAPLVHDSVLSPNYGSGMPVAVRTGISSGVTLVYSFSNQDLYGNSISEYRIRQSIDGVNFGNFSLMTQRGFGVEGFVGGVPTTENNRLSFKSPAIAFASGYYLTSGNNLTYVYYVAGVCQTYGVNPGQNVLFGDARGLCVYRIPASQVTNPLASWSKVLVSQAYGFPNNTKPVQAEAGFLTDIYGNILGAGSPNNPSSFINLKFACSGAADAKTLEICSGTGNANSP